MPFCVIALTALSKWCAHLHGSHRTTLVKKKMLSRREERQWIYKIHLLLGRDISILCFQETSVDGVCYQVLQWILAKPGHSWLPQRMLKLRQGWWGKWGAENPLGFCWCGVLNPVNHAACCSSKALSAKLLRVSKEWCPTISFKHFYCRKCVYASKEQLLPRKTKYQTINEISHNTL